MPTNAIDGSCYVTLVKAALLSWQCDLPSRLASIALCKDALGFSDAQHDQVR